MANPKEVVIELIDQEVLESNGVVVVAGTILPQENGPFAGKAVRYVSTVKKQPDQTTKEAIEQAHGLGAKMVR